MKRIDLLAATAVLMATACSTTPVDHTVTAFSPAVAEQIKRTKPGQYTFTLVMNDGRKIMLADTRIEGDAICGRELQGNPGCYPKADIHAVEYTILKANAGGTTQLWGALGTCVVLLPWCFAKGATAPGQ